MSDQPDNQSSDDKKISALYRAGSTTRPPEHIDQAIRAEARRSVNSMPRRVRSPWAVPVSMAAVLVLSVSLISLIHEEAPTVSDIRSDTPAMHAEEMEIVENSIKEKSVDNLKTLDDQVSAAETMGMTQPESDTEQKTERQKTTATKPSPLPQKSLASAKINAELTSNATVESSDKILQESLRRVTPQPESQSPATGLVDSSAEFSTGLKKDLGTKTRENCEQLSHSACLDSKQCSLIMNEQKTLICHRSKNHCDSEFTQRSDTKESCETKQGCAYIPPPCFCPPDVICICAGDQPPQCQPKKTGTQDQSRHPMPE